MKSYQSHLQSTFYKKNTIIRKPVFRSSAIFTYCINNKINTKILFLGYWLIKRNISQITVLVTIRDEIGNIIKRYNEEINSVMSYEIDVKKEIIKRKLSETLFGSIELEVFSSIDMVFPYPAFVVSYVGSSLSSVVHTCGRIYNDIEDVKDNNAYQVAESGFDILPNKNYSPFFSFTNGPRKIKSQIINIDIINCLGKKLSKSISIKNIEPYQTKFIFFINKGEKKFFLERKGIVKIHHNFRSFFPRFLCGNMKNDKSNSTLTHSYYDLKNSKEKTNYWVNPNKKKYFDSSIAIPIFKDKKFYTELAIYPNFPKCNFEMDMSLYNNKGEFLKNIKNFFSIKENFRKPAYLNINEILKRNNVRLNSNFNYFCKINTRYKSKILTRLKFGLNIGLNKFNSIPSNICFNAHIPNKDVLKKKSTFKWGLIQNINESLVVISNMSFLKNKFKKANIELKFWNANNSSYLKKNITINDNGSYWFYLSKEKKIKKFLDKKTGWITINSDNPFVNGWYLEISKKGSVGADHLF